MNLDNLLNNYKNDVDNLREDIINICREIRKIISNVVKSDVKCHIEINHENFSIIMYINVENNTKYETPLQTIFDKCKTFINLKENGLYFKSSSFITKEEVEKILSLFIIKSKKINV